MDYNKITHHLLSKLENIFLRNVYYLFLYFNAAQRTQQAHFCAHVFATVF